MFSILLIIKPFVLQIREKCIDICKFKYFVRRNCFEIFTFKRKKTIKTISNESMDINNLLIFTDV